MIHFRGTHWKRQFTTETVKTLEMGMLEDVRWLIPGPPTFRPTIEQADTKEHMMLAQAFLRKPPSGAFAIWAGSHLFV
jgi:hypothetical protein